MHTALIRVKVAPDAADRAADAMRTLVEPTMAEPGCSPYEFYRDLEDPSFPHVATFLTELGPLIEKWEHNHTAAL